MQAEYDFERIRELLHQKADLNARLRLIPYEGTPEVKSKGAGRYLYMRRRVAGKLTSTYVDIYSEELHQLLLRNAAEARELRKQLRRIQKQLASLGYAEGDLDPRVALNLDFARANMKASIYDQAVLEGVATSFPQTEEIIENGHVSGVTAADVQKVLNLKHAWEFVLDADVLSCATDFSVLSHIARLVNQGFYDDDGRVRGVPVVIGGTSYVPPLPQETVVKERLAEIIARGALGTQGVANIGRGSVDAIDGESRGDGHAAAARSDWEVVDVGGRAAAGSSDGKGAVGVVGAGKGAFGGAGGEAVDVAIELCLYCMKAQVFLDGNKRAAIIFANHYLIAHGGGLLVVPEPDVARFKELLIGHYEGVATDELAAFMRGRCWRKLA